LFSEGDKTGRNFGLLTVSAGLGTFLGGFMNGRIVDYGGFPLLFRFFSLFYLFVPLIAFFIEDRRIEIHPKVSHATIGAVFANRTFAWLFVACILAQSANIVLFLTRPVLMEQSHFDATAIGTANAVGSLITLPLPLGMGWLADRINRKVLLFTCFLAPALGLWVLIWANGLWSFWLSSILSTVVGSAQIKDMFPQELLSTPLALLNATPWIGIVLGLSAGGLTMSVFEIVPTLFFALMPSFVAIFLLTRIRDNLSPLQAATK
jgi:MFS family permease